MANYFNNPGVDFLSLGSAVITSTPFTFSAWCNNDDAATLAVMVAIHDTGSPNHRWELASDGDTMLAFVKGASAQVSTRSSGATSDGAWDHGAAVFSSNTARSVYLNGTETVGATTNSGALSGLDTTVIGDSPFGGFGIFAAAVAEAAIWNVALTTAEIAMLAAGYSPMFVRPQNLVTYLPLVRSINNLVGSAFTSNGTPTVVAHPRIIYPSPQQIFVPAAPAGIPLPVRRNIDGGMNQILGGMQ